jgi:hypothetical protein
MYNSKIINEFNKALFSTDYNGYDSATQNAKTDRLFEFDNFDEWFDMLIDIFADEFNIDPDLVRSELCDCVEFLDSMRAEYDELLDLLSDDEE